MLLLAEKTAKSQAMNSWLAKLGAMSAALAVALVPLSAHADEPEPVHRYGDDRRPPPPVRAKLLLTGAALTGAFYLPALGASYLYPDHEGAAQMRIPVAGPWMGLSHTKLCNARPELGDCNNFLQVFGAVLLVFDGIGQAGGVGLMLQSVFVPTGPSRAVRGSSEVAALTERDRLMWTLSSRSLSSRSLSSRSPSSRSGSSSIVSDSKNQFTITPVPFVPTESSVGLGFVGSF